MANYFVDFSAANNGDGSDGAQAGAPAGVGAFNQLTVTENAVLTAGDKVYLRRTGVGSVKTIAFKDGVYYYGWPKSTDENYAGRPSNTVDGTWNADGDDHTFFTAPTSTWTPIDIQVWRLRGVRTTSSNAFFYFTGAFEDFYANHCIVENSTAFGNIYIGGGAAGVGMLKMRDVELRGTNASSYFAIGPQTGPTGYYDIEISVNCTVANANDFTIAVNPNSSNELVGRLIITSYVNSGTGKIVWSQGGGAPGMWTIGFADGATGSAENKGITVSGPSTGGTRTRLQNIDQTGHTGATGLLFNNTRDSTLVEAKNCVFVGATNDISFSGNGRARLTGRNVTFDKTKVSFGANGAQLDPDFQAMFVEDFANTKGNYLRMNSRGFHQQSAAARTGGAAESILMETRLQSNPVGNSEPFMQSDAIGLEPLRAYLGSTSAKTVTVYIYTKDWDSNEDKSNIWLEVDYYDEVGTGHVKTASSRDTNLTPAALTSDGSSWSGVTGGTAQKLAVTFTPGRIGRCAIRVCVSDSYAPGGNRSKVYVDPIAVVT